MAAGEDDDKAGTTTANRSNQFGFPTSVDGIFIDSTARLPRGISANNITGRLERSDDDLAIEGGEGIAQKAPGRSKIRWMYVAGNDGMVRLAITPKVARSFLGRVRMAAEAVQPVNLIDNFGQTYTARAYILHKKNDDQRFGVDPIRGYPNGQSLPTNHIEEDDMLYLYFLVPQGRQITGFTFGSGGKHEPDEPLTVNPPERRR